MQTSNTLSLVSGDIRIKTNMSEFLEAHLKRLSLKDYEFVADKGERICYMCLHHHSVAEDKRKELLSQYKQSLSNLLEYTGSDDFTKKVMKNLINALITIKPTTCICLNLQLLDFSMEIVCSLVDKEIPFLGMGEE